MLWGAQTACAGSADAVLSAMRRGLPAEKSWYSKGMVRACGAHLQAGCLRSRFALPVLPADDANHSCGYRLGAVVFIDWNPRVR